MYDREDLQVSMLNLDRYVLLLYHCYYRVYQCLDLNKLLNYYIKKIFLIFFIESLGKYFNCAFV